MVCHLMFGSKEILQQIDKIIKEASSEEEVIEKLNILILREKINANKNERDKNRSLILSECDN